MNYISAKKQSNKDGCEYRTGRNGFRQNRRR